MNGNVRATAMQVATKLAKLEVIADLRYRGVQVEAGAVDVTPCHETSSDAFFRFILLRPVRRPLSEAPHRLGLPERWMSAAISIPRRSHGGLDGGLAHFETEFAIRTFLQRVEREIDDLLRRAEDQTAKQARRA
jgi:hypothetical protein